MKESLREFILNLGMDDVGFAAVSDYNSPRSLPLKEIFPEAKTIIVMVLREMSHCDSLSPNIAMGGRIDTMEFFRHCNFELARFVEKKLKGRAMGIPVSYPMDMNPAVKQGPVADVSLRHAAVAAGLGTFARNNLVIHPRLGSRILFSGVLTDLEITPDPPCTEEVCTQCNICVDICPAGALDQEGFTDHNKCLRVSQPYGLGRTIAFWRKFVGSPPEEQNKMFFSRDFWQTYQSQFLGSHYFCYKCFSDCPFVDGVES